MQMPHCGSVRPVVEAKSPANSTMRICAPIVPRMMDWKSQLLKKPAKMFNSPQTLRALISLKICKNTNVLKIMV